MIRAKHHGELLVGQADVVPTRHSQIPYLISAPTMRVPMILGAETVNVYLATRAVLLLIQHGSTEEGKPLHEVIKTVAIPGMGTGVGRVPYSVCAKQMRTAIEAVLLNQQEFPHTWVEAQAEHQALYSDSRRDLQYPDK